MNESPPLDMQLAHRQFSTGAFNLAWELIDKSDRTPEEDIQMLSSAAASLWHWIQRDDVTNQHRSVGYWQLSRVYALLGEGNMARRCGELCLKSSQQEAPFYLAYAHEALARAAMVAGDPETAQRHKSETQRYLNLVTETESRKLLVADLATIMT